jgi:DnaK suppressor protein
MRIAELLPHQVSIDAGRFGACPAFSASVMKRVTAADLKTFRALLLAERQSILGTSSSKLDVLELVDNVSAEDQAPLLHDQAVALHCRSQELVKLRKITAALERLRSGEFGICQSCEEPIPRKRLLAIPWAEHCVPCQERLHECARRGNELGLAA